MTKYNVSPLVAREIEFSTGTIFGGSWCRYFISITLHQCYIEATWKTPPKNDLDGNKEIFNSLQEYLDWFANLKKTYGRRISRKQRVYAAYDETTRTFSYKPYENWATRRSKEKLNKPKEPLLAINKIFWEALKTPPRTSIFIKIKVIIETSLEIILYICNEKYFSNNFNIDTL